MKKGPQTVRFILCSVFVSYVLDKAGKVNLRVVYRLHDNKHKISANQNNNIAFAVLSL